MDPDAPDESESDDDMYVYLEEDDFEDFGFDDCKSLEFLDLSLIPIQHQTGHLQCSSSERSQPDIIVSSTSGPIKVESTNTEHLISSPGISQEDDVRIV